MCICTLFYCLIGDAGESVVFTNDTKYETAEESQEAAKRSSLIKPTDTNACYRKFFVGKKPPIGFKSNKTIRYICQKSGSNTCFSTMFDLSYGIPIYSAYMVTKSQASKISQAPRVGNFRQEPGE